MTLESRVLVSARRFAELKVTDQEIQAGKPVEALQRLLQPPELLERRIAAAQ